MRKFRPLAIAVPAFLLGCLATACLTTTAKAREKVEPSRATYHIVTDEVSMNKYAQEGYAVKEANATTTHDWYLMQR